MITFSHSGGIGDILYSLYFCRDIVQYNGWQKFNFHIQVGVVDKDMQMQSHPNGNVRMTIGAAQFLKGLLQNQGYINEVSIGEGVPDNAFNLDLFRKLKLNTSSGDIRSWYYNLVKQNLSRKFWQRVLFVQQDNEFKDKIVLVKTSRYQNVFIDYKKLQPYSDKLIFFGTEKQHRDFCSENFSLAFYKCKDALDVAKKMYGAIGVIGNQSGLYSIAECLKVPRILLSAEFIKIHGGVYPGPHNVNPIGGWNEDCGTTAKMVSAINQLIFSNQILNSIKTS